MPIRPCPECGKMQHKKGCKYPARQARIDNWNILILRGIAASTRKHPHLDWQDQKAIITAVNNGLRRIRDARQEPFSDRLTEYLRTHTKC